MDDIIKYDVIDVNIDKNASKYIKDKGFIKFKLPNTNYKYSVQSRIVEDGSTIYYILLGNDKFNKNCKTLIKDEYGWYKIYLHPVIREYVNHIGDILHVGNTAIYEIDIEYIESTDTYDVYKLVVM